MELTLKNVTVGWGIIVRGLLNRVISYVWGVAIFVKIPGFSGWLFFSGPAN